MSDENKHPLVADTAPVLEQTVLDAETFQAWQSELNEFIAVTGNRLQSLSQSLSRCQHVPTTRQETPEIVPQSESIASTAIDSDPSPRMVGQIESPAQQPSNPGTDSAENNVVDQDPMQRLSAIKHRLANQMQNAS